MTGVPGQDGAPGDGSGGAANDGAPGTAGSLTTAFADEAGAPNTAIAHGAVGGNGGAGAFGTPPPENGGNGGAGGAGSAAVATAGSATAVFTQTASAYGGTGGAGGAAGGSDGGPVGSPGTGGAGGTALATATSSSGIASASALGGAGGAAGGPGGTGGTGGSASAHAETTIYPGFLDFPQVQANAVGGAGGAGGGGYGGAGGSATASVNATPIPGAPTVFQTATATGGRGGDGALGGGRGGDASIVNGFGAVTSAGSLLQSAEGGAGGSGPGSRGGDGLSLLTTATHDAPISVSLTSAAFGGDTTDGTGGDGRAGAILEDTGSPSVNVFAGGNGGDGAVGGIGTLDAVRGASNSGGAVQVKGTVRGGMGTAIGGSVQAVDAVSGATTGSLTLIQEAYGGFSAEAPGDGTTVLHGASSSQSLSVQTTAFGGTLNTTNYLYSNRRAGDAVAESDATNDAGIADAKATANGGNGVNLVSLIGGGGDASAVASASASGDGHVAQSLATATGGAGSVFNSGGLVLAPGVGLATSEAVALGEGSVRARAYGTGGKGVSANSAPGGTGQAIASAVGQNQIVDALASAVGGQSGPTFALNGGPQGVALANAIATGLATTQALAQTEGGGTSIGHATASQLGYQQVDAGSTTRANILARSNSFAARELATLHGDASALLAASGSGAFAIGDPGIAAVPSWIAGNPNVAAALGGSPVSVLGMLRAESSAHDVEAFAEFTRANLLAGQHFLVGFLDPEVGGLGFDALHVQIDANDQVLFARDFANVADALSGLDDFIVDVPFTALPAGGEISLRVMLSAKLSGVGNSFGADFALFAVPEPASAGLIAGALLLLAIRVRR